jgi:uncharacterized protein
MKLHAHPVAERAISHITSQTLTVAQTIYDSNVQISQAHGAQPWLVASMDNISEQDILYWIAQKPELVVFGSGKAHRFLPAKWIVQLSQNGIGIECMNTGAAARTYNVLLDEGRDVLGAFMIDPA